MKNNMLKKISSIVLTVFLVIAVLPISVNAACNHTYSYPCDFNCNICGMVRQIPYNSHVFSYPCDPVCNNCGGIRQTTSYAHRYDNDCDTTCNNCGIDYRTPKHTYNNDYDPVCKVCGFIRNVPFSGGDGTKTNPYLIQNKFQLNNVRNYLSSHFKLIDDIEFTESDFDEGGVFYNSGTRWQPIGNSSNYFTGVFDGDGHSIVNLEVLYAGNVSFGFAGLFYGNEGTIKNVKLENAWLSGGSMLSSQTATLGFIAGANDSTGVIDNCVIDSECIISRFLPNL